jgi:hypothetical protein
LLASRLRPGGGVVQRFVRQRSPCGPVRRCHRAEAPPGGGQNGGGQRRAGRILEREGDTRMRATKLLVGAVVCACVPAGVPALTDRQVPAANRWFEVEQGGMPAGWAVLSTQPFLGRRAPAPARFDSRERAVVAGRLERCVCSTFHSEVEVPAEPDVALVVHAELAEH